MLFLISNANLSFACPPFVDNRGSPYLKKRLLLAWIKVVVSSNSWWSWWTPAVGLTSFYNFQTCFTTSDCTLSMFQTFVPKFGHIYRFHQAVSFFFKLQGSTVGWVLSNMVAKSQLGGTSYSESQCDCFFILENSSSQKHIVTIHIRYSLWRNKLLTATFYTYRKWVG